MKTLNDAALALCERINKRSDCFKTIYLVFPNLKLQQWFKAFWLNTQGDRVLMNVSFETLDSILPLITERTGQEKYRLIKVNNLRQIIINILSNDLVQVDEEYKKYYEINGVKTPIKLYDFADSLAKLYLDYYLDNFEDIDKWGDPNSFERVLYDKVVELCKATKLGTIEKPAAKASPVDELIYLFGFGKYEKVYRKLLDEVIAKNPNNIVDFSIAIDRSIATSSRTYEICTAPSRVREVEYLHSTICELLNDKNNINRAIDFLVVAPNLDEYVTAIERVFKQDDKTFPSIPYVINYQQKKDTDVISALKILYQYCKDDFYTRLDFFELINNPVVRTVRKISDDDIDNWMKAVVDLKIHRQHGDNYKVDDWDYLKKRLVLSKVSSVNFTEDNLVALSEGNYLPYSNIGFDDNSIIKLVDIINDIDDFYSYFKSKTTININDAFIQEFKTKLDKWFKVTNIKDKAFAEYRKITSSLECLKTISAQNIDKDVLFSVLFNDGAISSTQLGTSFFEGVTFLNYDINSVVSAKYVFLLGASSNHLPKAIIKSELDFRLGPKTSDDEDIFYYLMQNATERFYMSFVNKDLKTDENFFLSPIVEDFNKLKGQEIKEISLDETRPYSDLYTRKEFNDREYYKNLFNNPANQWQPQAKAKPSRNVLPPSAAPRDIVTVSQMKAFLCEPLSYRAGRLFNKEDELQDEIIDEYEPLTLNKLETYGLSTDIVLRKLGDRYDFAETLSLFRLSHLLPTINSSYAGRRRLTSTIFTRRWRR